MEITQIRKRDGSIVSFKIEKVVSAVLKAFNETHEGGVVEAEKVATRVHDRIVAMCVQSVSGVHESFDSSVTKCIDGYPAVEEIQDLVEASLMEMDFFETAKAYILYRAQRKRLRERDVFAKRANLKPYEYPELYEYATAVRHSYWVHTEFNYSRDIDDFKTRVNEACLLYTSPSPRDCS